MQRFPPPTRLLRARLADVSAAARQTVTPEAEGLRKTEEDHGCPVSEHLTLPTDSVSSPSRCTTLVVFLTLVVEAPHSVGPAGRPLRVFKSDVVHPGLLRLPRLQPVQVQQVAGHRRRAAGPRPLLEAEHVQQRGLEVPQQVMALGGRTTLQAGNFLLPFFRYQTSMVALSQQDLAY
ncbi:hypothetical protein EYF80_048976 [Liparis tanakae]|uniref:Uncharacterized protein n=1 Tax=Liparis tanakae TaxID=230148 RepID=A0A4Z2FIU4_9TELE|nr:hypothetical protein EYF80_048976 [Liparis tanakae]